MTAPQWRPNHDRTGHPGRAAGRPPGQIERPAAEWEHETRNPAYDLATKAERELDTIRALQEEVQNIRQWVVHLQHHRE